MGQLAGCAHFLHFNTNSGEWYKKDNGGAEKMWDIFDDPSDRGTLFGICTHNRKKSKKKEIVHALVALGRLDHMHLTLDAFVKGGPFVPL